MGDLYMHNKTGGIYRLIDCAGRIEKEGMNGELQAVYQKVDTGCFWIRPKSEFFDGRFSEINGDLED